MMGEVNTEHDSIYVYIRVLKTYIYMCILYVLRSPFTKAVLLLLSCLRPVFLARKHLADPAPLKSANIQAALLGLDANPLIWRPERRFEAIESEAFEPCMQ